ncbi:MAG: hypothetical protein HOH19_00200 [Kordiimonadaceae bacterium]|jgi:hypothetical protein|nr:hypothetical protein [Kordiimonadaceae bacterium]
MLKYFNFIIPFLAFLLLGCEQSEKNTSNVLRAEMPLEKYDFNRTTYNPEDLKYLMGNAEMGGLADLKGLGFEKLWFTDVWRDKAARMPVNGPILYNSEYATKIPSQYTQNLSLKNGILSTIVKFSDGTGYETQMFFSGNDKHLLAIKIKDFSPVKTNWQISTPTEDFQVTKNKGIWSGHNNQYYSKINWTLNLSEGVLIQNKDQKFEFVLNCTSSGKVGHLSR